MSSKLKIIVGVVVAAVVLVVGGTFLYINVFSEDAPEELTLETDVTTTTIGGSSATTSGSGGGIEGVWTAKSDGTLVGYRVKEVLFGQSKEAAGRTSKVTGSMTVRGTSIDTVKLTVDMASVTSDSDRRDGQYRGRIMETDRFPTSTFELTKPIDLGGEPADGVVVDATATGKLTIHGVTKTVTIPLKAKRTGSTVAINGSIPITFADYNIGNPSGGPATTEDKGVMEFLVVFARASD